MLLSAASLLVLLAQASLGAVLVDFLVAQPLTLPQDAKQCTTKIVEYVNYLSF